MNRKEHKLAVLIDADNVPYSNVKGMLEEIAKYGTLTIKYLWRLDEAHRFWLEVGPARLCHHAYSAI